MEWVVENIKWVITTIFAAIIVICGVWYQLLRPYFKKKRGAKSTLQTALDRYLFQWEVVKEISIDHDIEAFWKSLSGISGISGIGDQIIEATFNVSGILPPKVIKEAREIGKEVQKLGQIKGFIRGGEKYRKFQKTGDELVKRSQKLLKCIGY